jgi:hypothetical protein
MKPVVYVETSIPSFYHEVRTDADMVARRQWLASGGLPPGSSGAGDQ